MEILSNENAHLRGRPSKAYLGTLRKMSRRDYRKLEKACLDAYLLNQNNVIVAFPYVTKFPEDFPHKRFVRTEGKLHLYRINAKVLLKWLQVKGYTEMTGANIGLAIQRFNQEMKELLLELQ